MLTVNVNHTVRANRTMSLDADLQALIERARKLPPPTALERLTQRRAMVRAEFAGSHPEMSAEEVDALLDRALG
jgi:hypothetical protein